MKQSTFSILHHQKYVFFKVYTIMFKSFMISKVNDFWNSHEHFCRNHCNTRHRFIFVLQMSQFNSLYHLIYVVYMSFICLWVFLYLISFLTQSCWFFTLTERDPLCVILLGKSFFFIMGRSGCRRSLHKTHHLKVKLIYAAAVALWPTESLWWSTQHNF